MLFKFKHITVFMCHINTISTFSQLKLQTNLFETYYFERHYVFFSIQDHNTDQQHGYISRYTKHRQCTPYEKIQN